MQILLPLKEFAAAKQRLAGVLSAAERAQLFEAMVEDVLLVLTQHPAIDNIAICSRDQAARWLANYYDVEFIDEARFSASDLNAAVNAAAQDVIARGENELMVVHGDLPLLTDNDITEFLKAHRCEDLATVTIAPDRHRSGTNLLAWRALPAFTVCYGENSFQRHCQKARALNIAPIICDLPGARCDIDEPDDLLTLLAQSKTNNSAEHCATKSLTFLRDSGVATRLLAMQRGANVSPAGDDRERA